MIEAQRRVPLYNQSQSVTDFDTFCRQTHILYYLFWHFIAQLSLSAHDFKCRNIILWCEWRVFKWVAWCLRRLTRNHSEVDVLSMTRAKLERFVIVAVKRLRPTSYPLPFFFISFPANMRPRWLDSQTVVALEYASQSEIPGAVFPNQVN